MSSPQGLFFELLLISIGAQSSLKNAYSVKQWGSALAIANEQAIAGVLLTALERLPADQYPPQTIILQWFADTELVERNTKRITHASKDVVSFFKQSGFACQILKGCAVGRYYPFPNRRCSGDVDVWLNGGRKRIYEFARGFDKEGKLYGVTYHHIHFNLFEDVPVEVHIWPSFLSSPFKNKKLQDFSKIYSPTFNSDMPSLAFDRVFILLHCYQHLCGHGIGLRQIMDYYYVLKQGYNEEECKESVKWIIKLGMGRFAKGMMWVLQHFFGLEDNYLLFKPDEKEGRFIMQEVLLAGNMGHYDTRNWRSTKTPFSRFLFNLKRDAYLAKHYPHEALWQPFFSIYFYIWRLLKGLLK